MTDNLIYKCPYCFKFWTCQVAIIKGTPICKDCKTRKDLPFYCGICDKIKKGNFNEVSKEKHCCGDCYKKFINYDPKRLG